MLLGLEGVGNLLSIPQEPSAAIWLAAKCLFIVGLIRGWRWVFVLFLVVAGLHVLGFSIQAPFVAFLNLGLVLLVGSTLRYFFPASNRRRPAVDVKVQPHGLFDRDFMRPDLRRWPQPATWPRANTPCLATCHRL